MVLRKPLRGLTCAAILAGCAAAADITSIRGELRSQDNPASLFVSVELVDAQRRMVVGRDTPSAGGAFEFGSVPQGQYELRVVDRNGDVIRREYVNATGAPNFITVNLPETKTERPVSGTVSVSSLQHKVPGKAQKEFRKSCDAMESGEIQKSIQHLERAVEIDPDYMEAHNNLGSRYFTVKDFDKAVTEFQKAAALDSSAELVQSNLALSLMLTRRFPEAETAARRSLELGHSRKACLALGMSLKEMWRGTSEAVEHLTHAAQEYPRARLVIAEILAKAGQRERAAEEVNTYLAADKAADREMVARWLARVSQ